MPLPSQPGRYLAIPTGWAVSEFNNSPIFDMQYQLLQFAGANGWEPVQGELHIKKRFFLKKNDGSWSQHAIESLMNSLGWDGSTLKALAGGDWNQVEVQLTIDFETSQKDNKQYIGVLFMNHRDYEGGTTLSSDPAIVQSLDAKYGNDLRNLSKAMGKTPAAATKPTNKPAPTNTAAKPTAGDPKQAAWKEFCLKTNGMAKEERNFKFAETAIAYSGKPDPKKLSPDEWTIVANKIAEFGVYVPETPDENAISVDDLPF